MTPTEPKSGILVGVDGSASAEAAVRWAVRDAAMHNEALTLMTVAAREDARVRNPEVAHRFRELARRHGAAILEKAQQVAESTLGERRLPDLHAEFGFGHPVGALVEASKDVRMAVVGCSGMGALERQLLGSVSTGLVHHAHCPVAVIHTETPEPARQAPVLVGIDGSPASELATAIAFDEASRRRAPLVAMHAWADTLALGHANWTIDEAEGQEVLSERLAGWGDRYPDVTVTPVLVEHDADRWLVNHSDEAQLVVVGSHGHGGFLGMLLGSVSTTVVHAARVPVIVARRQG